MFKNKPVSLLKNGKRIKFYWIYGFLQRSYAKAIFEESLRKALILVNGVIHFKHVSGLVARHSRFTSESYVLLLYCRYK